MTATISSDQVLSQRLRRLWAQFLGILEAAAISGDLGYAIEGALGVDSDSTAVQSYLPLLSTDGAKAQAELPSVQLADGDAMANAAGAYVSDLNQILINSSWLAGASDAEVIRVLAEEYGHSLDAKFNAADTPGDEGEKFAAVLLGYEAPASTEFENDSIIVTIDGVDYAAEAAISGPTGGGGSWSDPFRYNGDNSNDTLTAERTNTSGKFYQYITDITGGTTGDTDTITTGAGNVRIVVRNSAIPFIDRGNATAGTNGREVLVIESIRNSSGVLTNIDAGAAHPYVDAIYVASNADRAYNLAGNALNNTIGGSARTGDTLVGNDGSDYLYGNIYGTAASGSGTDTIVGNDVYTGGNGIDYCYYTTTNVAEAVVSSNSLLTASSSSDFLTANASTSNTSRRKRTDIEVLPSKISIDNNDELILLSAFAGYALYNQPGSINQYVYDPARVDAKGFVGEVVIVFSRQQKKNIVYEALADGSVTEHFTITADGNNVKLELAYQQLILGAPAPGTQFTRNNNTQQFEVVSGSTPPINLTSSNEDATRNIYNDELTEDGLTVFSELKKVSGNGNISGPLEDVDRGRYWIYTPLANDDSSVEFSAISAVYDPLKVTLDLLPLNDAPTINPNGVFQFDNTGDNTASNSVTPSDILTPTPIPPTPASSTINWEDVDDDFTPTFVPKKGLAITGVSGLGTWQYKTMPDDINWTTISRDVSETIALLIDESWQIRYVPDGLNGETAFFNFRAWDQTSGNAGSTADTVATNGDTSAFSTAIAKTEIVVDRVNDPPVANPDVATAGEAGGLSNQTLGTNPAGNVLSNDTDVDNSNTELSVASFSTGPTPGSGSLGTVGGAALAGNYGDLSLSSTGAYTYTVNNDNSFVQGLRTSSNTLTEVYNYTVQDPEGASDATTLTITITGANDNPVAIADTTTAVEAGGLNNGTAGINPSGNVLSNDTDVDAGDSKTVSAFSFGASPGTFGTPLQGTYGQLTLSSTGAYTYTVNNDNSFVQELRTSSNTLTEVFNYTMVDAAGASSATSLTVTISGANDNPIANADTTNAMEAGGGSNPDTTVASTGNVLTNDTDVDNFGETKTVSAIRLGAIAGSGTAGTVGTALDSTYGQLTLNSDGSYTYTLNNLNSTVQALANAAATLTDSFNYTVADAAGATAAAALTVTITGVNDAPELNTALSPALNSVTQNAPAPSNGSTAGSTLVSALVAGSSDVDAGAVKGIAITGTTTDGTLWYTTNGGTNWNQVGTVSGTNALLLAADPSTRLYYQPSTDYTGTVFDALTFRACDLTANTADSKVDPGAGGGTTAFSTASDTVAVTVSPLAWAETTKLSVLKGSEVFASFGITNSQNPPFPYPIGVAMRGLLGTTTPADVNLNINGGSTDIRIGVQNTALDGPTTGRNRSPGETLILGLLQDVRAIKLYFYGFTSNNSAGLDSGDSAELTFSGIDASGTRVTVPIPGETDSTPDRKTITAAILNADGMFELQVPVALMGLRLPEIQIKAAAGSFELDYAVQVQADAQTGTSGPDTLTGTLTRNIINALAGDDNITGGDGDDLIWAGPGSNSIDGRLGIDVFAFQQYDSIPLGATTPYTNRILAPDRGTFGDRIYFRNATSVAAPVQTSSTSGNNLWRATVSWGSTTEIFEFLLPDTVRLTAGQTPTSLLFA